MHFLRHDRSIQQVPIASLKPYGRNARRHSEKQIGQLARSIEQFGWTMPLLIDDDGCLIAGHGRLAAAKSLGLNAVPVIRVTDLTPQQVNALRLADNRIAEGASWDDDLLRFEIEELVAADLDFEITDTGFEMAEIDQILGEPDDDEDEEAQADRAGPAIARPGDLFACGPHKLLCADAREADAYEKLMEGRQAAAIVTDPPYNVAIVGNVSSTGRHGEFAMGSGEMSEADYSAFLDRSLGAMSAHTLPNALAFLFIDWRHIAQMIAAGSKAFGPLVNVCVWDKGSGGMGSPYRSAHELVCVFGQGQPVDNVQLGRFGRNRTNVWRYRGLNGFGRGRGQALKMHPTVKPVAMIADAILDCTARKDIVLDPFAGSGTILIAAHRTGRHGRAMEVDPAYVDVALRRYRRVVGVDPVLVGSGATLTELEASQIEEASDEQA